MQFREKQVCRYVKQQLLINETACDAFHVINAYTDQSCFYAALLLCHSCFYTTFDRPQQNSIENMPLFQHYVMCGSMFSTAL